MSEEYKNVEYKEDELTALGPCRICGKKLLETGDITFYHVRLTRAMVDIRALQRRVGLGMALGNDALARVMGPHDPLAKSFAGPDDIVVHETCAINPLLLIYLMKPDEDEQDGDSAA